MGRHLTLVALAAVLAFAPGRSDAAQTYKVKRGDSLYQIARTLHVDADSLKEANGLSSDKLKPGMTLKVPKHGSQERSDEATARKTDAKTSSKAEGKKEAKKESKAKDGRTAKAPESAKDEEKTSGPSTHVVKKGDTLKAIADAFDVPVKDLQRMNGLDKKSKLKPGMTLVLKDGEKPKKAAPSKRVVQETYVVKKGDNVAKVAKKFHLKTADLKRMNGLKSNSLKVGQKLVVEERVAQSEGDADDGVIECKLDEAKLSADLQEMAAAESDESGQEVGVTDRVMRVAKRMLGIPYRFGGNTSRGIDCSAYVQKVFRFLNLPLPRTAREQYAVGKEVPRESLETGDLVFFHTYARYPSHVGIYLGDSKFIHASSKGKKVSIDSLDTPFYNKRYIGAKRLVEDGEEQAEKPTAGAAEPTPG